MLKFFQSLFKPLPSISVKELEELLKTQKIEVIDVRTTGEYRGGHIRQAKNIPLGQLGTFQGTKDKPVYLICQSGLRSLKGAHSLTKKGYQAINVRGGMSAWTGPKVTSN